MLAVNQCQTHIFYQQKPLRKAMSKHKAILESWSPFMAGRNDFFKNETLMKIAAKHGKSVAQTKVKISNTCHFERSEKSINSLIHKVKIFAYIIMYSFFGEQDFCF